MAIFHLRARIVSRGSGRSVIANASYIHAGKVRSEYDGKTYDYSAKKGVVYEGVFLPPNVENIDHYRDWKKLWNSVEKTERNKRAQLARSLEISLPRELPLEKQIELVNEFLEPFAKRGMCVDYVIHDKQDGNPHCHALLTVRPLNPNGSWGAKSKKIYTYDKDGKKIYDKEKKQYKCKVVRTTDWDSKENLKLWRQQWADMANEKLAEIGATARIDHRSYVDQGIEKLPIIQFSKEEFALEEMGIHTFTFEINEQIDELNEIVEATSYEINSLSAGILRTLKSGDINNKKSRRRR